LVVQLDTEEFHYNSLRAPKSPHFGIYAQCQRAGGRCTRGLWPAAATVLIQQDRQPVGGLAQLLGFEPAGDLGEILLGGLAGVVVDKAGQPVEERPNDLDVFGTDLPTRLSGRGMRQHRLEGFTGQRGARPGSSASWIR
jgi:hypothetical protein